MSTSHVLDEQAIRADERKRVKDEWEEKRFGVDPSKQWSEIVDCCSTCARGAELESERIAAEAVVAFTERSIEWRNGMDAIREFMSSPEREAWEKENTGFGCPESKVEYNAAAESLYRLGAYHFWANAQILAAARKERTLS